MQAGQALSDADMKQLFHDLDLQYYQAKTEQDKQQVEFLRFYAEQEIANNIVANAERDTKGNVLLHGVPVRPTDALYFARLDVQHFEQTDRYLRPDQLFSTHHQSKQPHHLKKRSQSPVISHPKTLYISKHEAILVPPGVNLLKNIEMAKQHFPLDLTWFYSPMVHDYGPWDYKRKNIIYENFGNFHYGIVGTAQGIPEFILLRAAGIGQNMDHTTNSKWDSPLWKSPYGDDPKEQYWIKKGVKYYHEVYE